MHVGAYGIFIKYFERPGHELGLELVPQMDSLWIYDSDTAQKFLEELTTLKNFLQNKEVSPEIDMVKERLERLIPMVADAISGWDEVDEMTSG